MAISVPQKQRQYSAVKANPAFSQTYATAAAPTITHNNRFLVGDTPGVKTVYPDTDKVVKGAQAGSKFTGEIKPPISNTSELGYGGTGNIPLGNKAAPPNFHGQLGNIVSKQTGVKFTQKGGKAIGQTIKGPDAQAQAAKQQKEVQDILDSQSGVDPRFGQSQVEVQTVPHYKGGKLVGYKNVIVRHGAKAPPGEPAPPAPGENPNIAGGNPLENQLETTNTVNQSIQDFIKSIAPQIVEAQTRQGDVLEKAQNAQMSQIPLTQSMSPEQNAEIDNQQNAIYRQGMDAIERQTGMNARQTVADLRSSGFGSSNLGDIRYGEEVLRPQELMTRDLMDTLAKSRPETRSLYQSGATNALNAFNDIKQPSFPTNVPSPAAVPTNTYRPAPSLSDITQLMQLFDYLIPGANMENKQKLFQDYLNSIGYGTSASTPLGNTISAAGSIIGGYLGGKR